MARLLKLRRFYNQLCRFFDIICPTIKILPNATLKVIMNVIKRHKRATMEHIIYVA